MISTQRPGIYSQYLSSGIYSSSLSGTVAIIARNEKMDPSSTHEISRDTEADSLFEDKGLAHSMCCLALLNGARKVLFVCAGNGNLDEYQAAFELTEDIENISCIVCDSTERAVNTMLKESVVSASEKQNERIGIASCDISYVQDFVEEMQCERLVAFSQKAAISEESGYEGSYLCAALAGIIASNADPGQSFNGVKLQGIHKLEEKYSEEDIEDKLLKGITVFETIAGYIEAIRVVSSRTSTNGSSDMTYHDINVVMIIDDVIKDTRESLKNMISYSKNNEASRTAISTQCCVVLERKKQEQLINSYETPVVSADETDPSVCYVELKFAVARGLNQILITAYVAV